MVSTTLVFSIFAKPAQTFIIGLAPMPEFGYLDENRNQNDLDKRSSAMHFYKKSSEYMPESKAGSGGGDVPYIKRSTAFHFGK
mgnify:CR=1 FL=1